MRYILSLLLPILFFSGCVKKKTDIYVKGQILNIIDSIPIANTAFIMYEKFGNSTSKPQHSIQSFSTDANGYFGVNFQTLNSAIQIFWPNEIHTNNNLSITQSKYAGNTLDLGIIYTTKK